jgi:hypothetical protein
MSALLAEKCNSLDVYIKKPKRGNNQAYISFFLVTFVNTMVYRYTYIIHNKIQYNTYYEISYIQCLLNKRERELHFSARRADIFIDHGDQF